jgi:hypothetical protein
MFESRDDIIRVMDNRTPSKSLNSLVRLCVPGKVACPMFSLSVFASRVEDWRGAP